MFGKISLTESQIVALRTAFEVIRVCGSGVWVDGIQYMLLKDLPVKVCRVIRCEEIDLARVGMKRRVFYIEVQYQCGKMFLSLRIDREPEQSWRASSGDWRWEPSNNSFSVDARGYWSPHIAAATN